MSNWQDGIYLSSDPSLDANDRPLGWVGHTSAEGVLAANGSYTRTVSVRLPDSINGNFFLIVKADDNLYGFADTGPGAATGALQLGTDAVKEFRDEGNNQRNLPLPVTLAPAPDLRVTALTTPDHGTTGQFINLSYTVSNSGTGNTPPDQGSWSDLVYLSRDQLLDLNADRFLGSFNHTGGLLAGASYTIDTSLRLPTDTVGAYYVFVVTDPARPPSTPRGTVFERGADRRVPGHRPRAGRARAAAHERRGSGGQGLAHAAPRARPAHGGG